MRSSPSRILRPRSVARACYDRLSSWYDLVSAPFARANYMRVLRSYRPQECS
ncbi:MAG: hypothetical protein BMS9Abin28_0142 [Anaerolineae bacterium]|nr:MAG: hypothetical protein BMS9Abin28_0142 [Anaerolineae bacterium]